MTFSIDRVKASSKAVIAFSIVFGKLLFLVYYSISKSMLNDDLIHAIKASAQAF